MSLRDAVLPGRGEHGGVNYRACQLIPRSYRLLICTQNRHSFCIGNGISIKMPNRLQSNYSQRIDKALQHAVFQRNLIDTHRKSTLATNAYIKGSLLGVGLFTLLAGSNCIFAKDSLVVIPGVAARVGHFRCIPGIRESEKPHATAAKLFSIFG